MAVENLLGGIKENIKDIISFGPGFMLRHLSRGTSARKVPIAGFGSIHLRAGQSDCAVIRQVFRERQYELDVKNGLGKRVGLRYAEILSSGRIPVIVDAGANIGAASLWFLSTYPQAQVVAIEPEPDNLAVLRLNADGNEHLSVQAAAIGATAGFVSVRGDGPGWGAQTTRARTGIPIVTMDSAFRSVKRGVPFIAKIDIEGFEKDLFAENLEWLNDVYAVYIEPHDWLLPGQMTSRPFQCALARHSFEMMVSGDNLVFVRV